MSDPKLITAPSYQWFINWAKRNDKLPSEYRWMSSMPCLLAYRDVPLTVIHRVHPNITADPAWWAILNSRGITREYIDG